MAKNSYFLHGSQSEQRLVQDLINEQLKIYGLDVTYIPRKFINTKSIIEEVQSSKFDDNFVIEAYVNSYDGYSGAGDVLTKFGMSLRDEVELTISKERFEDFISPFMSASDDTIKGAINSSNLSFDTVSSTSSLKLIPNLVRTSPAPEYPSYELTYISTAKLSSNLDAVTSSIIVALLTNFLGIYVTSTPYIFRCSFIKF